jgi:DNA-binding GntR family transcriptional regulator
VSASQIEAKGAARTAAPDASEPLPISRRSLHDEVASRVRDMIIEGQLPPGGRVNEVLLGRALGVSRTPLREALKTLASEGLVDVIPARGAVVRAFTPRDVADSLEVLKALEQTAARLACARASEAEIARTLALHDEMMERYRARDRMAYFRLNQAIHSAIAAMSGNTVLAATHGTIQSRIRRIRFIGHEGAEKWADAVSEHEDMACALAARDGEALAAVVGRHLDAALERVRESI